MANVDHELGAIRFVVVRNFCSITISVKILQFRHRFNLKKKQINIISNKNTKLFIIIFRIYLDTPNSTSSFFYPANFCRKNNKISTLLTKWIAVLEKSISSVWKTAPKAFLLYDYFYVIVHTHEWEVKKETICNVHKLHQFNVLSIHTLLFCNNCACINWTIQLICICGNNFVFLSDSISHPLHFFVLQIHFPINFKFVLQYIFFCNMQCFFSLLHKKIISTVYIL